MTAPGYFDPAPEVEPVDHDFDQAWKDRRARPTRIRVMSHVYELPAKIPAKLILFAARAGRRGDDLARSMSEEELVGLLGSLLGADNVMAMLDAGIGIDELGDVLSYCMSRYRQWTPDSEGEAPAPAQGAASTSSG